MVGNSLNKRNEEFLESPAAFRHSVQQGAVLLFRYSVCARSCAGVRARADSLNVLQFRNVTPFLSGAK